MSGPTDSDASVYEVTASEPLPDGWLLAVRIPAPTRLCDGHFPGSPIVPGVTQLALVERALTAWRGTPTALAAIASLRLRQPVLPGDELEVRLRERAGGEVSFEVTRGGVLIANGVANGVATGMAAAMAPRPPDAGSPIASVASAFPPVEELLPHRGPMLFAGAVLAAAGGELVAQAAIPGDSPLAPGGVAPGFLALEAAAQTAGLHEAVGRADTAPGPRLGYLVAVRDAVLHLPSFPTGAPLRVTVRDAGGMGALASYEIEVALAADGRPVAQGRLSTYAVT
jgi:predicted hotdog family 3-hydroxylacyl-ACP dehydratase